MRFQQRIRSIIKDTKAFQEQSLKMCQTAGMNEKLRFANDHKNHPVFDRAGRYVAPKG
jgi:hypothetical protein